MSEDLSGIDSLLIPEAPALCFACGDKLCLRKQVINLSLGNTNEMFCLKCLAVNNSKLPEEILGGVKDYIMSRDCFSSQWVKYKNKDYCPDPYGCIPSVCFQ
jgi:hypothetical protein